MRRKKAEHCLKPFTGDSDMKQEGLEIAIRNRVFDHRQLEEIYKGLAHGLKLYQILQYADPRLSAYHMFLLRSAIEQGFSEAAIRVLADDTLDHLQLQQLYKKLYEGKLPQDITKCKKKGSGDN